MVLLWLGEGLRSRRAGDPGAQPCAAQAGLAQLDAVWEPVRLLGPTRPPLAGINHMSYRKRLRTRQKVRSSIGEFYKHRHCYCTSKTAESEYNRR